MFNWLIENFGLIELWVWPIYIVSISAWVLLERRPPVSTLAWILSLSFIPIVGFLIYYIFGPRKIERQKVSRKISKNLLSREQEIWGSHIWSHNTEKKYPSLTRLISRLCNMEPSYATHYKILSGGAATYDSIFAEIRQATQYILLEYYIFEADTTGRQLRDLLVEKAKQGVAIFLLVDRLGSIHLSRRFMRPLINAGGRLLYFHNINFRRYFSVINFRNHRKIVICDGKTAFTGGVNITDNQDLRRNPHAFHDIHIKLEGPIVTWFEVIFAQDWLYSQKTNNTDLIRILKATSDANLQWQRQLEATKQKADHNENLYIQTGTTPTHDTATSSSDSYFPHYSMQLIPSGPDTEHAPILQTMLSAMYLAKECIYLTTPYFVPDDAAIQALISASMRGVDVQVLVPQKPDNVIVRQAARSWYPDLIAGGIKVHEFTGGMLHTKTLIIDNDIGFIGSANFDYRSFYLNFEVSLICYDKSINQGLRDDFCRNLQSSIPFILKKQPLYIRLTQALARIFSPVL